MKLSFLVNYDAPALLALNYLLPGLDQHELSVFYTDKKAKPNPNNGATSILNELASFDRQLVENSELAINFKDPRFVKANKINTDDFSKLASSKPELIVSIRHMTILGDDVIALPQHGVINLHSGHLPQYQGVMASFRAMLNKQTVLGTCLHFIEDPNIDTGSIIAQSANHADYSRSYLWNVLNIYRAGCDTILSAIDQIEKANRLQSYPQTGDSQYYSYPSEKELAKAEFMLYEFSDSIRDFLYR